MSAEGGAPPPPDVADLIAASSSILSSRSCRLRFWFTSDSTKALMCDHCLSDGPPPRSASGMGMDATPCSRDQLGLVPTMGLT